MPRLAAAALITMAASFAAIWLPLRAARESVPQPVGAPPPGPAAAVRPPTSKAAPPQPSVPEASEARAADPQARVRQLARAGLQQERERRDAMLGFARLEDATIDERLDRFRSDLREAFAGTPQEPLLEDASVLTEIFLRAKPVQQELAALGPGARQLEIDHIRREMGFTDEEVARLERVDARRESRWQNGLAYMAERRRIASSFAGEALDGELRHLRERYFADEARTIELEEREGFFRFERPRVYGRN
jgi:hypothetical protein